MPDRAGVPEEACEAAMNGHPESWRETIESAVERAAPIIAAKAVEEEREWLKKVLNQAILDCSLAAHEGSISHDGSTDTHEAEREALERFKAALDQKGDTDGAALIAAERRMGNQNA
jgi:hypothetical protein